MNLLWAAAYNSDKFLSFNSSAPIQKDNFIQRVYTANVSVYVHDIILPEEIASLEADELSKKVRSVIESALPEKSKG